ncbi:MAG: restriction endonuclease subunit S [Methanothrix sp.]|nr:restriction endonuclease subunit S [Methanothrix sp.]
MLKRLKDITSYHKGKKPNILLDKSTDFSLPYLTADYFRNGVPTQFVPSECLSNCVVCGHNDIVLIWDGSRAGDVFSGLNGVLASTMIKIDSKEEHVLKDYILFYLKTQFKNLNDKTTGSSIPHIRKSLFENLQIDIPPLETQRRIVAILNKAEETRRLRAQADELESGLIQNIFMKMFGDPITNQKGWEIEALDTLCDELYRYPTFYGFDYSETGTPVVRISNILSNGFLDPTIANYAFIDEEINKRFPRTILELNDILMAVRGDGSTAKRIGLVNHPSLVGSNISPNLIRFKTNEIKLNPIFFFYLLTSPGGQRLLEKYVTRTAKKTITAGEIKRIKIICPPISIQQSFEQIARNEWWMKQKQERSKMITDNLFNTLVQKAFCGELVA